MRLGHNVFVERSDEENLVIRTLIKDKGLA